MAHAIQLWYVHRQSQINQGQAASALTIFEKIARDSLSQQTRELVTLICAELCHLTGNDVKAMEDINSILWETPLLAINARHLSGRLANDRSDYAQAEAAFDEAIRLETALTATRVPDLHSALGWRHLREREMSKALYEAQRARYELEQFEGEVEREMANYAASEAHFLQAMAIAETLTYPAGIAKTSTSLALLYLFQGEIEQAKQYLHRAATSYDKLGKVLQLASLQINWAVAHNLAGDYTQALVAATLARRQLTQFGPILPRQEALILQAMAEAHLGLGNLDEASAHVQQVVALEELDILTDAYCTFGQIQARRGQWEDAFELVEMSIRLATENSDRYYVANGWRVLGELYLAADRSAAAENALATAAQLFQELNLHRELTKIHQLQQDIQWKLANA
ncbi:MAG: hypothetical protein R2932_33870 [Caldilineaceae bacterium]